MQPTPDTCDNLYGLHENYPDGRPLVPSVSNRSEETDMCKCYNKKQELRRTEEHYANHITTSRGRHRVLDDAHLFWLTGAAKLVEQKTTRKRTEARYGQRPYVIRGERQDGCRSPNCYIQIERHPPKKSKYLIIMTVLMSHIIIIIIHFYCPAVLLVLKIVPVSLIKHFLLTVPPNIL